MAVELFLSHQHHRRFRWRIQRLILKIRRPNQLRDEWSPWKKSRERRKLMNLFIVLTNYRVWLMITDSDYKSCDESLKIIHLRLCPCCVNILLLLFSLQSHCVYHVIRMLSITHNMTDHRRFPSVSKYREKATMKKKPRRKETWRSLRMIGETYFFLMDKIN